MNDDEQLMERLRAIAAEVDGPPEVVVEAARAALETLRIDDAFARLVMDSETATTELVRAEGEHIRLLSFETDTVSVELQVHEVGGIRSVRGLVSGAEGDVVVETPAGSRTVPISPDGWFTVDALPLGSVRLRLRAVDGTAVTTSWVSL